MTEEERLFYFELKATFEKYLALIDQQILDYQADDDEEYTFLLKKAIEFRNSLQRVNDKLNQDDLL